MTTDTPEGRAKKIATADAAVHRLIQDVYLPNRRDAVAAIRDIARLYNVAVAYLGREEFEDYVEETRGEELTQAEWDKVRGELDSFDNFVSDCRNGDDGYVDKSFMRQVLDDCDIPGPDGEKWNTV